MTSLSSNRINLSKLCSNNGLASPAFYLLLHVLAVLLHTMFACSAITVCARVFFLLPRRAKTMHNIPNSKKHNDSDNENVHVLSVRLAAKLAR